MNIFKRVRAESNTCDAALGNANDKLTNLWDKIMNTLYDPQTDIIPATDSATVVNPYKTKRSFTDCSDTMQNRNKSIHKRGLVFQAKYVSIPNTFGYTGIFKTGWNYAIARFSYPTPPSLGGNIFHGFAMKFLLDNQPSVNFIALHQIDGADSFNLFRFSYSNLIASPSSFGLKVGLQSFRMAKYLAQDKWFASSEETDPLYLTIDPMAKVNGNDDYKAPHSIVCVPSDEIKNIYSSTGKDIDTTDFRKVLNRKGKDAKVFDVYAEKVDTSSKIGEIYAVSDFVASSFGDQQLFFQHHL